jgi:thiol:disulfide interchange protein DsbD
MMFKKTWIVLFLSTLLLLTSSVVFADEDELKVYNLSGEISAVPAKSAAFFIGIDIPEGYYIYANPKGPGTGMATEVFPSFPFKSDFREVRYMKGEEYRSEGDTADVNIYKKNTKIGISFLPSDKVKAGTYKMKLKVKALMCGYGACTPFEKILTIPVKITAAGTSQELSQETAMKDFLSMPEGSPVFETIDAKKIVESGKMVALIKSLKFSPVCPERGISGLIEAILLGILAGFILNFMPCVLPVVSLKILSFMENAHKSRKIIFIQGLLFSAGIIASFLVLATLAAFWGYKWGELFQSRKFIIVMTAFVFAMALSMFNVYIINTPAFTGKMISKKRNIYPDAFVKGVVATLLATPCSGPLLGGILAWVLQRPPVEIFAVFFSIGVGMALPYVILTARPALIKYIPKPGEWTVVFEEVMGFLLMLTAIYLVWISDISFRMNLVLFLFFVAFGFWQYGRFGSLEKGRFPELFPRLCWLLYSRGLFYLVSFIEGKAETSEKNLFPWRGFWLTG